MVAVSAHLRDDVRVDGALTHFLGRFVLDLRFVHTEDCGSLGWPPPSTEAPPTVSHKVCFPWFNVFPILRPPTVVVVVIVMAEDLKHLWVICCVFVSEKPKRIDFLSHFYAK